MGSEMCIRDSFIHLVRVRVCCADGVMTAKVRRYDLLVRRYDL